MAEPKKCEQCWALIPDSMTKCHTCQRYINREVLDYPMAFAIQRRGFEHLSPECSAVRTGGVMLCDCDGVRAAWELMRHRDDFEEWLYGPVK